MSPAELRRELETLHKESFGWAMRCCANDRALAEDVLQMVYLKVLDGKATFAGRSSFKTWLFAVIRTTAADERRRTFYRRMFLTDFTRSYQHAARDEHHFMEKDESIEELTSALGKLSKRQQEVLHLVFYQNLSLTEAAEVMRVSIGSARKHYERGKDKLRRLFKDKDKEIIQ